VLASSDGLDDLQQATSSSPSSQSEWSASPVTGLDFVAVPSTDWPRSRAFYVDTLGLRPDGTGKAEFWVGQTCFGIYEPTTFGMEFAPQTTAHLALHVDDMAAARADLEAKGVEFNGETFDTGVCYMAFFADPDGNALMLHHRYAPREGNDA
jgi:catechol 2,3-dioxygenase-like lactoylglutathione lyase family enzyme